MHLCRIRYYEKIFNDVSLRMLNGKRKYTIQVITWNEPVGKIAEVPWI
jgi:hypothetical protein